MAGLSTDGQTTLSPMSSPTHASISSPRSHQHRQVLQVHRYKVGVGRDTTNEDDIFTTGDGHAYLPVARLNFWNTSESKERTTKFRTAAESTGFRISDAETGHPDRLARLQMAGNKMARLAQCTDLGRREVSFLDFTL